MIEIRIIPSKETYPVRQAVLRKGESVSTCIFDGDDLFTTIHLGLYLRKEICGIISIYENKNVNFTHIKQFQIRGMAILEKHQNQGFGQELILKAEATISLKKAHIIWFNARESAVPFYKKLGYSIIDKPFIIGNIGTHYVMYKQL
jgi:ribosomal protein S18 acetylase RimI-like enzyme